MEDTENYSALQQHLICRQHRLNQLQRKKMKQKNPRPKSSHPLKSEMVNNTIKGLQKRGGSSLTAIKKLAILLQ